MADQADPTTDIAILNMGVGEVRDLQVSLTVLDKSGVSVTYDYTDISGNGTYLALTDAAGVFHDDAHIRDTTLQGQEATAPTIPIKFKIHAQQVTPAGGVVVTINEQFTQHLCEDTRRGCDGPLTIIINVTAASYWWQSQGGDVVANTNLNSNVPSTQKLIQDTPGVAVYGGNTGIPATVTNSNVSSTGWLDQTTIADSVKADSSYTAVKNRINESVTPTPVSGTVTFATIASDTPDNQAGYFYSSGNLTIENPTLINLRGRKVIIMADGDVTIKNSMYVDDSGTIAILTGGIINIDPAIGAGAFSDPSYTLRTPDIEALLLADGTIFTGTGTSSLKLSGAVIGHTGVTLQRKPLLTSYPAEYLIYDPNIIANLPAAILRQKVGSWAEVTP